MSNERDTKFAGFAKLLLEEIMNNNEVWYDTSDDNFKEDWQLLIAQRSYDLALHVLEHTPLSWLGQTEDMHNYLDSEMPDLTELPDS